jgi:hypothetical protein
MEVELTDLGEAGLDFTLLDGFDALLLELSEHYDGGGVREILPMLRHVPPLPHTLIVSADRRVAESEMAKRAGVEGWLPRLNPATRTGKWLTIADVMADLPGP